MLGQPGAAAMNITVTVNGQSHVLTAIAAHESLLHLLRERLGLTGTKNACEEGACGSCTVRMDGQPVYACLVPGVQLDGAHVTTVEGLSGDAGLSAIQRSFLAVGAVQCGFCTPGMLISADHLLATSPQPDERDIRAALAGNLCRCTGYQKIVEAVRLAAQLRQAPDDVTGIGHEIS
jgi:carbon-monoxide dehydrogenase small subunit